MANRRDGCNLRKHFTPLVPRTLRSVSSTVRCRAGAHASSAIRAAWVEALRSSERTLQRVRDTSVTSKLLYSLLTNSFANI